MKNVQKEMSSFSRDLPRESALKVPWPAPVAHVGPSWLHHRWLCGLMLLTGAQPGCAEQFAAHLRQRLNKDEYHFFPLFSR